ncbi:copper chaperone PCu(A)C [Pseudomonas sp. GZD-222]|uniref:copper chaperone PCu(A)C n=1 Tax=Pseudomonas sp. GZD-222 TaxID=3404805 RepID=UPI003BB70DDD
MIIRPLALCALFAFSTLTLAHEYQVGELLVSHPWSRELPVDLPGGSAYFTVLNQGAQTDRLIAVSSSRAQHATLHAQAGSEGMMTMQDVAGMDIPAHTEVAFKPGANHVMLTGMQQSLKAGEQFPLTLEFEKAGKLEVQVDVLPVEAQASQQAAHVH